MRQVIPFRKDIVFKTKIEEINSISLEHTLKLDNNNFITGEFIVSGDYKITENSSSLEEFNYNIPLDIALDNSYKSDESSIDIEDFYYEIINSDTLRVNIEVSIEGEIKEEENVEEVLLNSIEKNVEVLNDNDELFSFKSDEDDIEESREDAIIETNITNDELSNDVKQGIDEIKEENIKSLFSTINSEEEETFTTYNVHIVKENETIDTILKKYDITKEEFLNYNTLEEIVVGNKLIIPSPQNE